MTSSYSHCHLDLIDNPQLPVNLKHDNELDVLRTGDADKRSVYSKQCLVECVLSADLELARSLCEGRNIFIANQKRWIELTDLTVCIESSSTITEDTPDLLTALVSKSSVVCLDENYEELQVIFAEQLAIFFQEDLCLTITGLALDVAKLVVAIYRDAKKISNLFNRLEYQS